MLCKVNMKNKNFAESCYQLLTQIPKGKVTTYKEMARALGSKGYRAVGNAMHNNKNAPKIPCHRVVRSDGDLGGYALGVPKKKAILKNEGINIEDNCVVPLEKFMHVFKASKSRNAR